MPATEHLVDANGGLRYLTNDVPAQAEAVKRIFRRAENSEIALRTSALSIAEIVWTLETYYEVGSEGIRDRILAIPNTPGLEVEEDKLISRVINLYVNENIDFIHAYNGLWLRDRGLTSAFSFDIKHFRRIPGIDVRAPDDLGSVGAEEK